MSLLLKDILKQFLKHTILVQCMKWGSLELVA